MSISLPFYNKITSPQTLLVNDLIQYYSFSFEWSSLYFVYPMIRVCCHWIRNTVEFSAEHQKWVSRLRKVHQHAIIVLPRTGYNSNPSAHSIELCQTSNSFLGLLISIRGGSWYRMAMTQWEKLVTWKFANIGYFASMKILSLFRFQLAHFYDSIQLKSCKFAWKIRRIIDLQIAFKTINLLRFYQGILSVL